jgi:transcriptional regulator with XRE-family HTH domain
MPFNRQLGQRVRAKRRALGMTQKQLGERLGLSYQQVQRYESGADGMSAIRLYEISRVMGVSPGSFYPPSNDGAGAGTNVNGVTTDELSSFINRLRPDTIKLARAFENIRGSKRRLQVIELVETFASRYATSWPSRYKQVGVE